MLDWWPLIGETSLALGSGLGLVWAIISTLRRRGKFLRTAMPPVGQFRWFVLNLLSMGCYGTLISALGLASLHDIIPQTLFWFLLGLSACSLGAALMFPGTTTVHPALAARAGQEPPADPPLLPVRKSA